MPHVDDEFTPFNLFGLVFANPILQLEAEESDWFGSDLEQLDRWSRGHVEALWPFLPT